MPEDADCCAASPPTSGDAAVPAPPAAAGRSGLPDAVLGMAVFLATEIMFFAGLVSAFLVLRAGAAVWPPPGQPRLPVAVSTLNTLALLASGVTLALAVRAARAGDRRRAAARLTWTLALGVLFLGVQGQEWTRLVGFGLTLSSGLYGATFYAIVGLHGLHALGGLPVLASAMRVTARGEGGPGRLLASAMYWWFVVAVWPVLYAVVYLA